MLMFGLLASPFPGLFGLVDFGGNLLVLLGFATLGIVGFGLMAVSTFLPEGEPKAVLDQRNEENKDTGT
jgi:hypothetical protein